MRWFLATGLVLGIQNGNPKCWSQGFTYDRCCSASAGDSCWDGVTFTYVTCCFAPGGLALPPVTATAGSTSVAPMGMMPDPAVSIPRVMLDSQTSVGAQDLTTRNFAPAAEVPSAQPARAAARQLEVDAHALTHPVADDPSIVTIRAEAARRSKRYLRSAEQWLERARAAQNRGRAEATRKMKDSVSGRVPANELLPDASVALVLNTLLWGAMTELMAATELASRDDSQTWSQAARLMSDMAKLGQSNNPSIFDPDALDVHTEALVMRACKLVGCTSEAMRISAQRHGEPESEFDWSPEDLLNDDAPSAYVFTSAEPTLRPVRLSDDPPRKKNSSAIPMVEEDEPDMDFMKLNIDMDKIAVKQDLFPTNVWIVPLAQQVLPDYIPFLSKTAVEMFDYFRKDLVAKSGPVSLDNVNNAFFGWQPSSMEEIAEPARNVYPAMYDSWQFWQLRELLLQAGRAYLEARGDRRANEIDVALWASVYYEEGAGIDYHDHPLAILSGVFYVEAPPGSPIGFVDPRGAQFDYMEKSSMEGSIGYEPKAPFHRPVYFEPRSGDLILFPPWLLHKVPPIAAGPRVAFACNFFARADSPINAWSSQP